MNKPFPALCRDCKHSKPEESNSSFLRCSHPKVNGEDSWALASGGRYFGSECRSERDRGMFAPCGKRGKLWEPKPAAQGDAL